MSFVSFDGHLNWDVLNAGLDVASELRIRLTRSLTIKHRERHSDRIRNKIRDELIDRLLNSLRDILPSRF